LHDLELEYGIEQRRIERIVEWGHGYSAETHRLSCRTMMIISDASLQIKVFVNGGYMNIHTSSGDTVGLACSAGRHSLRAGQSSSARPSRWTNEMVKGAE
jgi:hypothetical protein